MTITGGYDNSPVSLTRNVVANYFGQVWRALIGLAFIPLYIEYLGMEAWGLIGVFAVLQAWLTLMDIGMRPVLMREMARSIGGARDAQSIRDLLRSAEILALLLAALVATFFWGLSGTLSSRWLNVQELSVEVAANALAAMGVVTALRLVENIYIASLTGLQRQVLENALSSIIATVRAAGAVAVLAWVSPSIEAYFLWQATVSLLTVPIFAVATHRLLPPSPRPARFSRTAVLGIWRFAAGMMAITFLTLLLTQVDKLLLSWLLPLRTFGYYALAGMVAGALHRLTSPIATAFYPRFTELATRGDSRSLSGLYHAAAQLVTVCAGAAAIMLLVFGESIVRLWTGNPELARHVGPLVVILAAGTLCNVLIRIPYHMQLAHGWTALAIRFDAAAVVVLVPGIIIVVPQFGAAGAAWIWLILNTCYVALQIPLMHRTLLPAEMWRWYGLDVAMPLAAASGMAWFCRMLMPHGLTRLGETTALVLTGGCVAAAATMTAPIVRSALLRHLPRFEITGER